MRRFAPLAYLLLNACSSALAEPPPHGETAGRECQRAGLQHFLGQPATDNIGAQILRVSQAAALRWVRPGRMVTMEYRANRVTVHLNSKNRIERATCG